MVLLGGAMYGTMSSFVKLSYSWGIMPLKSLFAQAALAAIFLGTYNFSYRKKYSRENYPKRFITVDIDRKCYRSD